MRNLAVERDPAAEWRSVGVKASAGSSVPPIAIDYGRRVHGLFGLIYDVIAVDEVVDRLLSAMATGRRCHLATPNANFLRMAGGDPQFRAALLTCDLSTLDGMPLVLLARFLGVRASRASGADVFEALQHDPRRKVRAYFFGGDAATAQRLHRKLDGERNGVVCVGATAPPFGSIDAAATQEAIEAINSKAVDLVSVSVGARNGVAWIADNEGCLEAPILANLGAVIHFATGALPRAPVWMRRSGLEWLWRIATEPALSQRYLRDGLTLVSIVLLRLVPSLLLSQVLRLAGSPAPRRVTVTSSARGTCLTLAGAWREADLDPLRETLAAADRKGGDLTLDCDDVAFLDTAALGLILLACGAQRRRGRGFALRASRWPLRAWFSANGCGFLLSNAEPGRDPRASVGWSRAEAPAPQ